MATLVRERQFLTLPEVAALLRVSQRTARRLIDERGLPALRVGGQIRVDTVELETWLYEDPAVQVVRPENPAERDGPEPLPAVEPSAHAGDERAC